MSVMKIGRPLALAAFCALATTSVWATDTDGDGLNDIDDNCINVSNADQRDTDGDDFGNACDADLNNDDIVNVVDLGILRTRFFTADDDADLNGDGVVNVVDLGIMRQLFFVAPGPSGIAIANTPLQLTRIFAGVSMSSPLSMRQTPADPNRWYFLERAGRLVSLEADDATTSLKTVMNTPSVDTNFEGGALGFDFHPDFANNGHIYVSYTAEGPTFAVPLVSRIARFDTSIDPADGMIIADPDSEEIILEVNQPFANHNGGNMLFGPDGLLYLGLGDGGSGGDPSNHGQRTETLLGSMVRIDVDVTQADFDNGVRYYIPEGNPFSASPECGQGDGCPEIFAYGLRNPWRWSFDRETGDLWAGDVGQGAREEVSVITEGGNFGWRCREGILSFNSTGCGPATDYIEPIVDYSHSFGFSITGGYVYRGSQIPNFQGMYLYSDFGSGRFWGVYNFDDAGELFDTTFNVVSFGEDLDGEIYVLASSRVYRLELAP
ncbi:MAG: PQQ-dependent sugar dehydrogenase [Gammaproteobacteria bacterium]